MIQDSFLPPLPPLNGTENGLPAQAQSKSTQESLFEVDNLANFNSGAQIDNDLKIATVLPVARLLNLCLPREYLVPKKLIDKVSPGCLVRIKLAGKLINAWVKKIDEPRPLTKALPCIERVISSLVLADSQMMILAQAVAEHYCDAASQILNRAIPARHASVEKQMLITGSPRRLLSNLNDRVEISKRQALSQVIVAAPEPGYGAAYGQIWKQIEATLVDEQGQVLCLFPDLRAAKGFMSYLENNVGELMRGRYCIYYAGMDKAKRYQTYLQIKNGEIDLVIGLRSAVFAPLPQLKTILIWDDGSDYYREETNPYWHTREIAEIRATLQKLQLIYAGYTVSIAAAGVLEEGGELIDLRPSGEAQGRIEAVSYLENAHLPAYYQQIPSYVLHAIKEGLQNGPVLIQVPLQSRVRTWGCEQCGERQHCTHCATTLNVFHTAIEHYWYCPRCRRRYPVKCRNCGGTKTRVYQRGIGFIMRDLQANFRGVPIHESRAGFGLTRIANQPSLVVATTGSEPLCEGGYRMIVAIDADLLPRMDKTWCAEEALRRWSNLAAQLHPEGTLYLLGPIGSELAGCITERRQLQWARTQYQERKMLGFPPAGRIYSLIANSSTMNKIQNALKWPRGDILGPISYRVNGKDALRMLLRAPSFASDELKVRSEHLFMLKCQAVSRKWGRLRIDIDPEDF